MNAGASAAGRRLRAAALACVLAAGHVRGLLRYATRAAVRRQALDRAEVLVRGTSRESEVRRIARSLVVEQSVEWVAVRWYQLARDLPVHGVEHLRAAESAGRGVLLATTHAGWVQCMTWRMARAGLGYTAVSGGWIAHSTQPSDLRQMPMVEDGIAAGARHIVAGSGAFQQLDAVVAAGGRAAMAIDMPGSLETVYLGKPARLGQATFRISWQNTAPVVPMFIRRKGLRLWIELHPAIRPEESATYEEHVRAITDELSRLTLPFAGLYTAKIIDTLWPGGSADAALPNRATWADKLASRA